MTDTYSEEIVQFKKFVIEQLLKSRDANIEYKLCFDYIHNYKNENYRNLMTNKSGKSALDLYKEATTFLSKTNNWIYNQLASMSKEDRAQLINEPKEMSNFIEKIHDVIKENHDGIFLLRT